MTFDVLTTDWTIARKKMAAGWQPAEKAADIFEGSAHCEIATIEGVAVTRLCVRPQAKAPKGKDELAKINKSFAVCFEADWQSQPIEKTELPFGMTWLQAKPGRFDFHFDMPAELRAHGLGERFSDLNLRGTRHTLCATDNPHHNEHADTLYKSIPFLILADGAKYTGIFLDSPAPQRWDLDTEMIAQGKIELFTRRGFYLYTFAATSLPALVQAFTRLTGRAPLPPRWSLGHQQCRWSYPDEATIRELASQFRKRKIPCDTLVLDIDYMDEYRVFTHSKERFPSFSKLAHELDSDQFKLITIVDPGVKKDEKFEIYRRGKSRSLFCKTVKGEVFIGRVWPGLSALPDFLMEETRQWWGENLKFYVDNGIAGIWNDMNEPALFDHERPLPDPLIEMPEDNKQLFLQQGEDGPIGHLEVRNLYGFLMSLATHDALVKQRPDERPFVLTRSASTGIQRHAAVWLGDNTSWFEHLQKSLPMLLNMGLSGVTFAGVDIGGFGGDTNPELLVRWYELGIFYPFFRNHCALMGRPQEPFAFSAPVEAMVRHLIEWRYRLLPYIQGLFWEHTRTGAPLMRPMAWHYGDDEIALTCDDQFMFGQDIMVAPILSANHRSRYVYFPEGNWYALDPEYIEKNKEGKDPANCSRQGDSTAPLAIVGGQTHRIECPLGCLPAFVRQGAVIALADIMQSTVDYDNAAVTFHAFGDPATGHYFEDDGHSLDYKNGKFNEWEITVIDGRFQANCLHRGAAPKERDLSGRHFFNTVNGCAAVNLV